MAGEEFTDGSGLGMVNDVVRFLLELVTLGAVAWWGFDRGGVGGVALGLALPVVVAFGWVTFINPNGRALLRDPARLFAEVLVFGGGVAALAGVGASEAAVVVAAIALVHLGLTFPLDQRAGRPRA